MCLPVYVGEWVSELPDLSPLFYLLWKTGDGVFRFALYPFLVRPSPGRPSVCPERFEGE